MIRRSSEFPQGGLECYGKKPCAGKTLIMKLPIADLKVCKGDIWGVTDWFGGRETGFSRTRLENLKKGRGAWRFYEDNTRKRCTAGI